jgi:hypothetical protein
MLSIALIERAFYLLFQTRLELCCSERLSYACLNGTADFKNMIQNQSIPYFINIAVLTRAMLSDALAAKLFLLFVCPFHPKRS